MAKKFEEMDEMMQNLAHQPSSQMVLMSLKSTQTVTQLMTDHNSESSNMLIFSQEQKRVQGILMEYQKKKAVSIYEEWLPLLILRLKDHSEGIKVLSF